MSSKPPPLKNIINKDGKIKEATKKVEEMRTNPNSWLLKSCRHKGKK